MQELLKAKQQSLYPSPLLTQMIQSLFHLQVLHHPQGTGFGQVSSLYLNLAMRQNLNSRRPILPAPMGELY